MANWINNLFGLSLTPTVSFIILFAAIILGVLLLVFIARRLLGGTFVSGGRGRHLRLAVMDATPVDSRRRLVLVRRDDVEHLILIGGPTDVVVEQNIRIDGPRDVKSAPAPVEQAAPARPVVELPRPPEAVRVEPPRQAPPAMPQPAPMPVRPQPVQTAPVAPQPRPAVPPYQPAPMPSRPAAPAAPVAPQVVPPRPPVAPVTRIEPAAAALASRPDPVMAHSVAAPSAAPKPPVPAKPAQDDLDESLIADLSESLNFDDDIGAPEVSLEKEMESLLSTLDTQKDRIS